VRNTEVLNKDKEERKMVHTVNSSNFNWIGHIWHKNRLLKDVIEGKVEGMM
jgi:hypothetical protein